MCVIPELGALQRIPELADRDLTLTVLSGGITNRNFLITIAGATERYVIRLAGNDTHLLGISREAEYAATVAAAYSTSRLMPRRCVSFPSSAPSSAYRSSRIAT